MANPLSRLFLDHPQSVNETYTEHMGVALYFFFWLTVAAFCALVHAFIPAAFDKTASRIVKKLYARMTSGKRGEVPVHAVRQ